jgi:BsaWI restriction endonuclease type 2
LKAQDVDQEEEFKKDVEKVFGDTLNEGIRKFGQGNLLDHLGEILKGSEDKVVDLVVPRSVKKFATGKFAESLTRSLEENPGAPGQLRDIGVSIANTLRPLAGNRFTRLVRDQIEAPLKADGIRVATKGKIRKELNDAIDEAGEGADAAEGAQLKPDLDIVCYDEDRQKAFLIISCKTTFAERLLQTVSWNTYIKALAKKGLDIKIFIVTAWEDLDNPTQRKRARVLDGAYVANTVVKEDDKVKRLSRIVADIIDARDEILGRPNQQRIDSGS